MPQLPQPSRYFPLEKGIYEVAPGLRPLGSDFGNGEADKRIFQLDAEFHRYRENKIANREERLGKYYCTSEYPDSVAAGINNFLAQRLAQEYPQYFSWDGECFSAQLTNEKLYFSRAGVFLRAKTTISPPYASGLDALASQVQEDIAIVCADTTRDWLAALHLSSPSHWAAEDKIGKDFFAIHAPIPGSEKMNRSARALVEAMIHKGPYVRFVWGFATDRRLNHHPVAPSGQDELAWQGRSFFQPADGSTPFVLRVERQTLWGFPALNAALFGIRVYFIDGCEIRQNPEERELLSAALRSMTPESLRYKGLSECLPDVLRWLAE